MLHKHCDIPGDLFVCKEVIIAVESFFTVASLTDRRSARDYPSSIQKKMVVFFFLVLLFLRCAFPCEWHSIAHAQSASAEEKGRCKG